MDEGCVPMLHNLGLAITISKFGALLVESCLMAPMGTKRQAPTKMFIQLQGSAYGSISKEKIYIFILSLELC